MEEDIRFLEEMKENCLKGKNYDDKARYFKAQAIENILNELERLQKENKKLISDNLEYQRMQDIFNERTYRKKYLEERRKEEPNLLYPDADEIYQRYYKLKKENEELKENYKVLENAYMIDSIPKSVIQDKIYELGNMTLITVRQREEVNYAMGVLQELLNKGE